MGRRTKWSIIGGKKSKTLAWPWVSLDAHKEGALEEEG